jgi:hypothetical protein
VWEAGSISSKQEKNMTLVDLGEQRLSKQRRQERKYANDLCKVIMRNVGHIPKAQRAAVLAHTVNSISHSFSHFLMMRQRYRTADRVRMTDPRMGLDTDVINILESYSETFRELKVRQAWQPTRAQWENYFHPR